MDSEPSDITWRRAARSQANGNCVEVAELGEIRIAVRDSKDPEGAHLVFGPSAWRAFAVGLKQP